MHLLGIAEAMVRKTKVVTEPQISAAAMTFGSFLPVSFGDVAAVGLASEPVWMITFGSVGTNFSWAARSAFSRSVIVVGLDDGVYKLLNENMKRETQRVVE